MIDLRSTGGVWTAAILPLRPDGSIDRASFRSFVEWNAGHDGVNAIVVNGHASETGALDEREYEQLISDAREAVPDGVGVVSGVMAESAAAAASIGQRAMRAGADALLLFPPEGFVLGAAARPEMFERFVATVAEHTEAQICYFQRPVDRGAGLSAETLRSICEAVPSVIAIKEGSDSMFAYEQNLAVLRDLDREVTVLTSNNRWLFGTLALGGTGVLSGSASVIPGRLHRILMAIAANDLETARAVNRSILPLIEVFYRAPLIDMHSRMKFALTCMGIIPAATVREPLVELPAAERAQIERAVCAAGLLSPELGRS